jgi:hypothetical protein
MGGSSAKEDLKQGGCGLHHVVHTAHNTTHSRSKQFRLSARPCAYRCPCR